MPDPNFGAMGGGWYNPWEKAYASPSQWATFDPTDISRSGYFQLGGPTTIESLLQQYTGQAAPYQTWQPPRAGAPQVAGPTSQSFAGARGGGAPRGGGTNPFGTQENPTYFGPEGQPYVGSGPSYWFNQADNTWYMGTPDGQITRSTGPNWQLQAYGGGDAPLGARGGGGGGTRSIPAPRPSPEAGNINSFGGGSPFGGGGMGNFNPMMMGGGFGGSPFGGGMGMGGFGGSPFGGGMGGMFGGGMGGGFGQNQLMAMLAPLFQMWQQQQQPQVVPPIFGQGSMGPGSPGWNQGGQGQQQPVSQGGFGQQQQAGGFQGGGYPQGPIGIGGGNPPAFGGGQQQGGQFNGPTVPTFGLGGGYPANPLGLGSGGQVQLPQNPLQPISGW